MQELQHLEPQPPTPSTLSNQPHSEEPQVQPHTSALDDNDQPQNRPDSDFNGPTAIDRLGSVAAFHGPRSGTWMRIVQAWRQHISPSVDHAACRDHLALERTFLGYLRTSVWLANLGVLIAQLFSLQVVDSGFGYARVGKPMATVCFAAAIVTIVLGAIRMWRYQSALRRGTALSGGVELMSLGVGLLAILCAFFGLVLAIEVSKDRQALPH